METGVFRRMDAARRRAHAERAVRHARHLVPPEELVQVDRATSRTACCSRRSATSSFTPCARTIGRSPRTLTHEPPAIPAPRGARPHARAARRPARVLRARRVGAGLRRAADSTIRLTLGDAVRLATQQNPKVGSARGRVSARAGARDAESRRPAADGLGVGRRAWQHVQQRGAVPARLPGRARTASAARSGTARSSVRSTCSTRARKLHQSVYDPGAIARVRGARTTVQAASADLANEAEVAAYDAANAYLARAARRRRVQRALRRFDARRRPAHASRRTSCAPARAWRST